MTDKRQLFLAFADKSIARPVKARMRAVETRRTNILQKKAMQKALTERDILMRLWKRWRKEVLNDTLAGPYEQAIMKLIRFLENSTLKELNRNLLKFVMQGPWLTAPADIKFLSLRLIDAQITKLRIQQELPPFDDPILGQPLSPFLVIRNKFIGIT